jgi:E3 ubiquitin-protein ligase HERC1
MALSEEGEVYTWGLGALPHLGVNGLGHPGYLTVSRPQLVEALRSEKVVDIAIGAVHALVVTADGRVLSWGRGDFGLLGTGRARDRRLPGPISLARASGPFSRVFAARHHSAALATDGALVTFGRNLHGQLGRELGSTLSAFSSDPYPVAVLDNVTHAACGTSHMVACTANGHLYQWGFSGTASAQVPMNVSMAWAGLDKLHFKEVAAGRQFSLALDASGRVFAWGSGLHGATGLGDRARRLAPEELASFGPDTKIGPAARIFAGPRVSAALVAHSTQSN